MNYTEIRQRLLDRILAELPPAWGEFYRSSVGYALVQAIAAEFAYLRQEVAEAFSESFLSTARSESALIDWAQLFGYPVRRSSAAVAEIPFSLGSGYPPLMLTTFPFDLWESNLLPDNIYQGDPVIRVGDIPLSLDGLVPGTPKTFSPRKYILSGTGGTLSLVAGVWKLQAKDFQEFLEDPQWLLEGPVDQDRVVVYFRYTDGSQYRWRPIALYSELFKALEWGGLQEVTYQKDSLLIRYEEDFPVPWPSDRGLLVAIWFQPSLRSLGESSDWISRNWQAFQELGGLVLGDGSSDGGWVLVRDHVPRESVESLKGNLKRWVASKGSLVNSQDLRLFAFRLLPGLSDLSVHPVSYGYIKLSYLFKDGSSYRNLSSSEKTYLLSELSKASLPGVTYELEDPIPKNLSLSLSISVETGRIIEVQESVNRVLAEFPLVLGSSFPISKLIRELNLIPGVAAVAYTVVSSEPVSSYKEYHRPTFALNWDLL